MITTTTPRTSGPSARSAMLLPRVAIIGIGVQKAATSWLFRCLAEHPGIRTAAVDDTSDKELNFFNHFHERGYGWYHRGFEFGPWRTLEFSTLYFHDANVPGRIRAYNPDARLLLAIRNPVDRALSQHRHEIRRGRVPDGLHHFWDAAEQNPSYIEQGRYGSHLERWLEYFDLDQLHIVDYDDVARDPAGVLRRVHAFAAVDIDFVPKARDRRINESLVPRDARLEHTMRWGSRTARRLLGDTLVDLVGRSGVPGRIRKRNRVVLDDRRVPPLTAHERARLADVFADDNRMLERLLGRDFTHWK